MLVYLYCTTILERWKSISYLSNKKSIRKVDGFPTTIGSFCVDPHTAATMHPAPAHLYRINIMEKTTISRNIGKGVSFAKDEPGHSCKSVI